MEGAKAPEHLWGEFAGNIEKRGTGENWKRELQFALLAATDPQRAASLCLKLLRNRTTRQRMSAILLEIEQANHLRMYLKPFRFIFMGQANQEIEKEAKRMQEKVEELIHERKQNRRKDKYIQSIIKRAGDIFLGLAFLVLLLPFAILYLLVIWAKRQSWPLKKYYRIGYGAKIIKTYEIATFWSGSDKQYTRKPIDRFLYTTSLHQYPSYWNVLKGDMSIIGPYPLCCYWATKLDDKMALRFTMKPGLAGLAQVNAYINKLNWKAYLEFDDEYINSWNVWRDIKLSWLSLLCILGADVKPMHLSWHQKADETKIEASPGLRNLLDFTYELERKNAYQ